MIVLARGGQNAGRPGRRQGAPCSRRPTATRRTTRERPKRGRTGVPAVVGESDRARYKSPREGLARKSEARVEKSTTGGERRGPSRADPQGVFRRRADALVEPHRMSADDLRERAENLDDVEAKPQRPEDASNATESDGGPREKTMIRRSPSWLNVTWSRWQSRGARTVFAGRVLGDVFTGSGLRELPALGQRCECRCGVCMQLRSRGLLGCRVWDTSFECRDSKSGPLRRASTRPVSLKRRTSEIRRRKRVSCALVRTCRSHVASAPRAGPHRGRSLCTSTTRFRQCA